MILAVDLGNYNTKTSTGFSFSSRFTTGEFAPVGEETLEFNGTTYVMAKGSFEFTFNKAQKNYMPNLLYAIGKSTQEEEINLVLGVPLDNLGIRETFKKELLNKKFDFIINGEKRHIEIKKFATVGEGMSSFYVLSPLDKEKDLIIIDIGGRTSNVAAFINKRCEKKFTVNIGMIDLYDRIKTKLNESGNNYNVEEIERLIKSEFIDSKIVNSEKEIILDSIMNEIELKLKYNTYSLAFTGGGSIDLHDAINKKFKSAIFIPDALFSNVKGNKIIADQKWR